MTSYLQYGFEPCNFEPDTCEQCKQVKPLYFGDRDAFEPRDGSYLCGECIEKRILADKATMEYVDEMIQNQLDHESSHMPWML